MLPPRSPSYCYKAPPQNTKPQPASPQPPTPPPTANPAQSCQHLPTPTGSYNPRQLLPEPAKSCRNLPLPKGSENPHQIPASSRQHPADPIRSHQKAPAPTRQPLHLPSHAGTAESCQSCRINRSSEMAPPDQHIPVTDYTSNAQSPAKPRHQPPDSLSPKRPIPQPSTSPPNRQSSPIPPEPANTCQDPMDLKITANTCHYSRRSHQTPPEPVPSIPKSHHHRRSNISPAESCQSCRINRSSASTPLNRANS